MSHPSGMVPVLPWPFPDESFPQHLGAVVTNSVLDGSMPALQVVHFPGGEWGIADGVGRPHERNCTATHIWHVLERDASLLRLAALSPGFQADRDSPGDDWAISPYEPEEPIRLRDRVRQFIDVLRFGADDAEARQAHRAGRVDRGSRSEGDGR